jgi:hypothetical protein
VAQTRAAHGARAGARVSGGDCCVCRYDRRDVAVDACPTRHRPCNSVGWAKARQRRAHVRSCVGARWARGVYHRAALRADPLALPTLRRKKESRHSTLTKVIPGGPQVGPCLTDAAPGGRSRNAVRVLEPLRCDPNECRNGHRGCLCRWIHETSELLAFADPVSRG